jgi:hypothetical protein
MALSDRFQNELLEPEHLSQICRAQPPLTGSTSQASAAAQNNPSTSAYAITRADQTNKHASRIPQSATSGAILQNTPHNLHPDQTLPSLRNFSLDQTSTTTTIRSVPFQYRTAAATTTTNKTKQPKPRILSHPSSSTSTTTQPLKNGLSAAIRNITHPQPATAPTAAAAAVVVITAELEDEETRTRRVFAHLERLCETHAARQSLRAWQAGYCRRKGMLLGVPSWLVGDGVYSSGGFGGGGGGQ